MIKMIMMHEAFRDDLLQHGKQMVPIPVDVQDDDRFLVKIKLAPGGDLHGLVKGAKPARQHHEGIAFAIHHLFTLMHGIDHMKLGYAFMSDFHPVEKFRDDPGHMAAGIDRPIGHLSHQSAASATIDQPHPEAGDHPTQFVGCFAVNRVNAGGGTGKNADFFHV